MNHFLVGQDKLSIRNDEPCADVFRRISDRLPGLNRSMISQVDQSKLMLMGDFGWFNAWDYSVPPRFHFQWHGQPMKHNLAFMDGHAAFVSIRKGFNVTPQYSLVPFKDGQREAEECQECPSVNPWCR